MPTERTIRFYTSSGLVDRPVAGRAGRSLYGYRHLLQVLAVKYLQSQYLPLAKVRSIVENADNRDLELMIPAIPPVTAAHRVFSSGSGRVNFSSPDRPGDAAASPASSRHPASATQTTAGDPLETWHRLEVVPGVELFVLDAALSGEQRERIRGALLREVGTLRGWYGGGEKT